MSYRALAHARRSTIHAVGNSAPLRVLDGKMKRPATKWMLKLHGSGRLVYSFRIPAFSITASVQLSGWSSIPPRVGSSWLVGLIRPAHALQNSHSVSYLHSLSALLLLELQKPFMGGAESCCNCNPHCACPPSRF